MLPFCYRSIKCHKPLKKTPLRIVRPYPENPQTLGEHIRKRRIDLGLPQPEMAKMLGVSNAAAADWEYDDTLPLKRFWRRIKEFIGPDSAHAIDRLLRAKGSNIACR
jgi:DNA-binding XRE family transcriptional regulator